MKSMPKYNLIIPTLGVGALIVLLTFSALQSANAATVPFGSTTNFAVLASSTITNAGTSVITGTAGGDIGVSPGAAFADNGFLSTNGVQHLNDAVALTAQTDLEAAYNDAAGRTPVTQVATALGGLTFHAGSFNTASGELSISGVLTLDAQDDPNALFIFIAGSTLVTASGSSVVLLNGAQPCNVIWVIGSSATLGTNSLLVGRVLATASITATTGAEIVGQLLALNGAITLDSNVITNNFCSGSPTETATPTAIPSTMPTDLVCRR